MAASGVPIPIRAVTVSGTPAATFKVYGWVPDSNGSPTATPKTFYTDANASTPASNPETLGAATRVIYKRPGDDIVIVIKSSDDAVTYSTEFYPGGVNAGSVDDGWDTLLNAPPPTTLAGWGITDASKVVATLAALQALDTSGLTTGYTVLMQGRGAAGDRGGGVFRLVTGDQSATCVASTKTVSAIDTSTDVLTSTGHELLTRDIVVASASVNGLTGLTTLYYVNRVDADNFTLHTNYADAVSGSSKVDITGTLTSLSVKLLKDPLQGILVISAGANLDGSSGIWKRQLEGMPNVDMFGADPTGASDSLPAFNGAIVWVRGSFGAQSEGGGFWVLEGAYQVADSIDMHQRHGVHIYGESPVTSLIFITPSTDKPVIKDEGANDRQTNNWGVHSVGIQGGGNTLTSAHGIKCVYSQTARITGCHFVACRAAMYFQHVWQNYVLDNRVYNNLPATSTNKCHYGIYQDQSDNYPTEPVDCALIASGNSIFDTVSHSIRTINGQGSVLTNNQQGASGAKGFYVGDGSDGTIPCAWMHIGTLLTDSNVEEGLYMKKGAMASLHQFQFSNLWCGNNAAHVYIEDGDGIVLLGMLLITCPGTALNLVRVTRSVFSGTAREYRSDSSGSDYGIRCEDSSYNRFTGHIYSSTAASNGDVVETGTSDYNMFDVAADNYTLAGAHSRNITADGTQCVAGNSELRASSTSAGSPGVWLEAQGVNNIQYWADKANSGRHSWSHNNRGTLDAYLDLSGNFTAVGALAGDSVRLARDKVVRLGTTSDGYFEIASGTSSLYINRFNSSGVYQDTPVAIDLSTGVVNSKGYVLAAIGSTGGTGSAGAGNQYIELYHPATGVTYKVLHDGTV